MVADDLTLLRRTHAGHEPSARELWRRHAGWMLLFARGILGRRHGSGAEDVVQAVFCRMLGLDRRSIRAVREVRPWLAQLVRRQALNQMRTAARAARREAARPAPSAPSPTSGADVASAMASLPRRLREVLYLRHVAGLSTDQTALALDVPRGTVASRHHAAVMALRAAVEAGSEPVSDMLGEPAHAHAD